MEREIKADSNHKVKERPRCQNSGVDFLLLESLTVLNQRVRQQIQVHQWENLPLNPTSISKILAPLSCRVSDECTVGGQWSCSEIQRWLFRLICGARVWTLRSGISYFLRSGCRRSHDARWEANGAGQRCGWDLQSALRPHGKLISSMKIKDAVTASNNTTSPKYWE